MQRSLQTLTKKRLFSYLRISDVRQASGTGIARQIEGARKWALEHGFVFDESLTMRDLGKSAFRGKNTEMGSALGAFIEQIKSGRIEQGCVLYVEALDRLSRDKVVKAMNLLTTIIGHGITVVTGTDGNVYNQQTIEENPGLLFVSVGMMVRNNDESRMKRDRVRDAMRIKCERWQKGERGIHLAVGADPSWVQYSKDEKRFEIIEKHAEPVRAMIRYFREGHGGTAILERLRTDGYTAPKGISNTSRVYQIMRCRNLVGERLVTIMDKETQKVEYSATLKDYYPSLMTEAEFQSLQHLLDQRGRRHGKGTLVNLFTGAGLMRCGHCSRPVVAQNILSRNKQDDGRPQDGHRRLRCSGVTTMENRCAHGSCSAVPVERGVMAFCANQFNLSALVEGNDPSKGIAGRLAIARGEQKKLERKMNNLTLSIADCEDDDDVQREFFQTEARSIGKTLKTTREEVAHLEQELAHAQSLSVPAAAGEWAKLVHGVEALDHDARTTARRLVLDTFERITIFINGFRSVADGETPPIGLVLVSKAGISRRLELDRVSGSLISGVDADLSAVKAARRKLDRARRAA
ncbi:Resolvase domain [Burkholderia sp. H160]|nr:Resolvase domain [Burkholderia sp. H160]